MDKLSFANDAFWGLRFSQREKLIRCSCRHLSRYSPYGSIIDKTMLAANAAAPEGIIDYAEAMLIRSEENKFQGLAISEN